MNMNKEYEELHQEEGKCRNVEGFCEYCGTEMVGHQTLEEWKIIRKKNLEDYLNSRKPIEKTETNPNGVAIGCNLDPNDKSADSPRRRVGD